MTYRAQTGSRRGSGKKPQKTTRKTKAKPKTKQAKTTKRIYTRKEEPVVLPKEVAEKTVANLNRLGAQTFAVSPFSNYFDEWLTNLRMAISEFESSPQITADEEFNKQRAQIFLDIERELADKRIQETDLTGDAKTLHDQNHLLGDLDAEYANKNRELSDKRNADVQRLTNKVHELEVALDEEQTKKFGFFQVSAKRESAKKISQLTEDLAKGKSELEVTLQNFDVEQEKLHDNYEKKKQDVMQTIRELEKKLEWLETDASVQARKTACDALVSAVNTLIGRISPVKDAADK
ncbi:MAG: hypothetical protein NWF01_10145 [Candidatus Bathyarchaeota archaeon]|nr:hypothetical protein [Candidatus Bathyarchaeota archaeon]